MLKKLKDIFKSKPSSALFLVLAIITSLSAYSNLQNGKPIMAGAGAAIAIACLWYFFKEKNRQPDDDE